MFDYLWPYELKHARPPCPSPTPGFTQTHVHWVGDAIQPSHPVLSPSPPFPTLLSLSQHQGLIHESALRTRWRNYWSFNFIISPSNEHSGLFPLGWTRWISLQSKELSRVLSNTSVQKHQFFGAQLSLQSNSQHHDHHEHHTWPLEKPQLWLDRPLLAK